MSKQGYCKFCKKQKQLIKAHIIPRNFYLDYKKEKYLSVDLANGQWEQKECGSYDDNILCSDCDNGLLKNFDDEGYKILLFNLNKYIEKEVDEGKLYHITQKDFDYSLLRKFFISILWRASISTIDDFKYVDLGKYEDIAYKIILGEYENFNLFNVLIFKCPADKQFNKMVFIQKGRFCKAITYTIFMASFQIVIVINNSGIPLDEMKIFNQLFISKTDVYILESEYIYNDKIQFLSKLVKDLKKIIKILKKENKCKD